MAGARSVVCVAVAYATGGPALRARRGRGRVSNYAWSSDYHRPLRTLLGRLAAAVDAIAQGPASAIVCDTAPLAERAFAASAGLGWVGKHTNLIAPGLGSFVFLGEVVTTLALDPDQASKRGRDDQSKEHFGIGHHCLRRAEHDPILNPGVKICSGLVLMAPLATCRKIAWDDPDPRGPTATQNRVGEGHSMDVSPDEHNLL